MARLKMMTIEDFPENWQEFILNGMADEGWRLKETIAFLARDMEKRGFNYRIHARIYKDTEEYRDVIDEGRMLSEAWWMTQGRINLENRDFNNTNWIFTMKASFGWNDRPVVQTNETSPFNDVIEKAELYEKFKPKEMTN